MKNLIARSQGGFTLIELMIVVAIHRHLGGHSHSCVSGLHGARAGLKGLAGLASSAKAYVAEVFQSGWDDRVASGYFTDYVGPTVASSSLLPRFAPTKVDGFFKSWHIANLNYSIVRIVRRGI